MSGYLIADGGSTKTEWVLIEEDNTLRHFLTTGINPYLESKENILAMLRTELPWDNSIKVGQVFYYGAGSSTKEKQKDLEGVIKEHFNTKKVEVRGDLLAAAQSLCGSEKGMICILGTGSSSAYYNGKTVREQQPSLGYIAGDEGSGNYMGKRILQYYTYGTFDYELKVGFEMRFGKDVKAIVNKLYHEPYPNRFLASFVSLLAENRGHYMVENIIEDCINDFFQTNILKYRQSWNLPINFSGSVGYVFKDVIENLCGQYELELGRIEKNPMPGLIQFYLKNNLQQNAAAAGETGSVA
jgi:glucosamine kinase